MRKLYRINKNTFAPGWRIGPRDISIRKTCLTFGRNIINTIGPIGSRIDIYFDEGTGVMSFKKGSTLLLYSMNPKPKDAVSPASVNCSSKGLLKHFKINFRGKLEGWWNEAEKAWEVTIPNHIDF